MNTFEYRNLKKKNYFEGWYQRVTDENNNINYSIIFAITKDENDSHSFIQIFDVVLFSWQVPNGKSTISTFLSK